jgi:glucose-1-phosphate cytidylyltransferase
MVEIGGMPVLWHILKYYSYFGHNDFIICCGYKGYVIKEYFANYFLHRSDVTFDFSQENKMIVHNNVAEPWRVTLIDTGLNTMTGGRIKRIQKYVGDEPFMFSYGDGVSDIDLNGLIKYHNASKKIVTLTTVQPGGRFGMVETDENGRISFFEKTKEDGGWINGGFMIIEPEIFKYIENDGTIFEKHTLEKLSENNKLAAFKHHGFWQCMDTMRDKNFLDELIEKNKAPWMVWE